MNNASHAYFNIFEENLTDKGHNDIENVDEIGKRATRAAMPKTYTARPPPDSSSCFNVTSSDHSRIHEVGTFLFTFSIHVTQTSGPMFEYAIFCPTNFD